MVRIHVLGRMICYSLFNCRQFLIILNIRIMKKIYLFFFACVSILFIKKINAQIDTIIVDTLAREYIKHIPATYNPSEPIPLMIALHNAYGSASEFVTMTKLSEKADEEGFIVVYPNGTGNPKFWNAGGCCGSAMNNDIDDVGFISVLIDTLCVSYNIDTTKIFIAGFSNGSIMAYRLAAELSSKIFGIACVAGQMMLDNINPERPVPIIHFHALDDVGVPFEGGEGSGYIFPSVNSVLNIWIEINDCADEPEILVDEQGVNGKRWISDSSANIVLYTIPKGGHSWPVNSISATDLLWEFFTTGNAIAEIPEPTNFGNLSSNISLMSFQCHPNPFSVSATISFELKQRGYVQLNVYDLYGRLVSNLINQELNIGTYNIVFANNNKFTNGIYLLKFQTGNEYFTRRIIICSDE